MSSKSNIYCCVPGCMQKGTVDVIPLDVIQYGDAVS